MPVWQATVIAVAVISQIHSEMLPFVTVGGFLRVLWERLSSSVYVALTAGLGLGNSGLGLTGETVPYASPLL